MNTRNITIPVLIAIVLVIFCYLLVGLVSAAPPPVRIAQGDSIYLNGTYDISGVIGWDSRAGDSNYIAHCGGFTCYDTSTPYLLKLPPRARTPGSESLYNYWIDPEIFAGRTGDWFQYDKSDAGSHGNTMAFRVVAMYQNQTLVYPNGTTINQSVIAWGDIEGLKLIPDYILPEKPVADYLLARGDDFSISGDTIQKIWIFGRNTPLYDYETDNGDLTYNQSITETMEPGSYYLMKHFPGKNGDFDVRYFDDRIQWKNKWSGIVNVDVPGIQPLMVADMVAKSINKTDDEFVLYKLEVQAPSVTIEGFSEVPITTRYSRYEEYRTEEGFVSLFDVRGYTNFVPGTVITVTLDPTRRTPLDIAQFTFNTTAKRQDGGSMSYYRVYVPIVWDDMTVGMHTLEVSSRFGTKMYYDFPISVLPEDSFKPNATVKYTGDRNPWVPTPTPEVQITIIEKRVVVTQTILVPVTPTNEVVKEEQKNIILEYIAYGIIGLIITAAIVLAIRYVVSVFRRARLK